MSLPLVLIAAAGAGVAVVAVKRYRTRDADSSKDPASHDPGKSAQHTADSGDDVDDNGVVDGAAGGLGSVGTAPKPTQFPQDGITGSGAPSGSDAPTPSGGMAGAPTHSLIGNAPVSTTPTRTGPSPTATKYTIARVSTVAFSNDSGMTSQQTDQAYTDGTAAKLGLVW